MLLKMLLLLFIFQSFPLVMDDGCVALFLSLLLIKTGSVVFPPIFDFFALFMAPFPERGLRRCPGGSDVWFYEGAGQFSTQRCT